MRPVFAFSFLVRLRDHGAWSTLSQSRIFYLAFFISHFYLAFLSRISHFYLAFRIFYLASGIFISHFLSRISHFYLAFLSHISHFYLAFLSHISHFYLASRIIYLAFTSRNFFLFILSRILNVPYRLPYEIVELGKHFELIWHTLYFFDRCIILLKSFMHPQLSW